MHRGSAVLQEEVPKPGLGVADRFLRLRATGREVGERPGIQAVHEAVETRLDALPHTTVRAHRDGFLAAGQGGELGDLDPPRRVITEDVHPADRRVAEALGGVGVGDSGPVGLGDCHD